MLNMGSKTYVTRQCKIKRLIVSHYLKRQDRLLYDVSANLYSSSMDVTCARSPARGLILSYTMESIRKTRSREENELTKKKSFDSANHIFIFGFYQQREV